MPPKTKPAATSCSKSKSKSKKKKSGGDDMYGTRWTRSANDAQPQSQGHYTHRQIKMGHVPAANNVK